MRSPILPGHCTPSSTQKAVDCVFAVNLLGWLLVAVKELPIAVGQQVEGVVVGGEISFSCSHTVLVAPTEDLSHSRVPGCTTPCTTPMHGHSLSV